MKVIIGKMLLLGRWIQDILKRHYRVRDPTFAVCTENSSNNPDNFSTYPFLTGLENSKIVSLRR